MGKNLVIAALALATALPVHAGMIEDTVAFDRAYIPALALSNQPQKPAAAVEESFRRLDAAWADYLRTLGPRAKSENALAVVLAESDANIRRGAILVAAGKRAEAHEALEHVRVAFWNWRASKGIEYYPDRLTAFHEVMEELLDLSKKPDANLAAARKLQAEASKRWGDVERAKLDAGLHGFDAEKTAKLAGLVARERAILDGIAGSIAAGERTKLAEQAAAMRGTFAQAYLLFGDFTGL